MTCATAATYACATEEYAKTFDFVVADEAGHATEPETIAAFAWHLKPNGTLVIAGDHKQLGSIIQSPAAL
ncbi:AAA domain-containing protein [bacterium]|nr:AAA domain-containing protein [bacterium]|tara:strand:+ start:30144 stop:30353 length:210 start_codon:yes stop_codon:yes gene_type:complete